MICNKPHRYEKKFEDLPGDQGDPGRHRCAGCAYDLGVKSIMEGGPANLDAETLPFSQADAVRHRSLLAAFEMGRRDALLLRQG